MRADRDPANEDRAGGGVFVVARWMLRIVVTATAGLVMLQPVSIGQYLQGRYAMLAMHAGVADAAAAVGFFAIFVSAFYTVVGGRVWVMIVTLALGFAIDVQLAMGYAHQLGIHVPLGVAIVAGAIALAAWSWTPASARSRHRPRVASRRSAQPETEQVR